MERLTTAQQDSINKTGTARLIVKLSKAGFAEADLDKMDRPALIAAWAECVASGKEVPTPVPSQTFGYDADLERQKLAFETRRFEAQQKERADAKTKASSDRAMKFSGAVRNLSVMKNCVMTKFNVKNSYVLMIFRGRNAGGGRRRKNRSE